MHYIHIHPQRFGSNAISAPMIAQFHDAICTLESLSSDPSSPLVAVIISGAARTFCAGFDLDLAEMIGVGAGDQGMGEEEIKRNGYEMSLAMGDALRRLRKMELISVAAVDGYAIVGTTSRGAGPSCLGRNRSLYFLFSC